MVDGLDKMGFAILETLSSRVTRKNIFNKRSSIYVPDFFLIFFCLILFSLSAVLDICVIINLSFQNKVVLLIIFVVTSFGCTVHLVLKNKLETSILNINKYFMIFFCGLGFGPTFICLNILLETIAETVPGDGYAFPFQFFHIPDKSLAAFKIYCLIHSVTKTIPQFCIMSIIIKDSCDWDKSSLLEISVFEIHIFINAVIFCQTIAMTFPIQSTPKVYKSCDGILLNASNKFLAAMCACYVYLLVFSITYQSISYYAIVLVLGKTIIWLFPCWSVLKSQPVPLSHISLTLNLLLITLSSSIIYIHPFEEYGKLLYYIFNLLSFLFEIFCLYFFSELDSKTITFLFAIKPLMLGFLSCFGMVNITQQVKVANEKLTTHNKTILKKINSGIDENTQTDLIENLPPNTEKKKGRKA